MAESGAEDTHPEQLEQADQEEVESFVDAADQAEETDSTPEPATTQHDRNASITNGTVREKDHPVIHATDMTQPSSTEDAEDIDRTPRRKASVSTERTEAASTKSRNTSVDQSEPAAKDVSMKPPPKPSRFGNFSASLPSVPWGASQNKTAAARSPSPQPPPKDNPPTQARKISTTFGWLSRATTGASKDIKSPPLPPRPTDARRNTAASVSTLGSNQDLMLKAIDEGQDNGSRRPARDSLKERFKQLRMREEIGVPSSDDQDKTEPDPTSPSDEKKDGLQLRVPSPTANIPLPLASPALTVDPNLPPGTIQGFSIAAQENQVPIDWDFWQTVVNEGPQAVAKSSPEELTAAIAGGIPSTIRGVIWQVLAGSKNEDLEAVYYELKVRGTKDELKEARSSSIVSAQADAKEMESTVSSRSSIHSEQSTPATSAHPGLASPSPSKELSDPVNDIKLQTQLATERAHKAKEDAAALSKLEKMIKRDMGSRTSYSKYAAAAGLQDGLFNVCKAYALFDDAVGYPQGMNFIIMPLLFNMPEEEAFCLLVRLMNKYQLRELFIMDMPGLHLHLYQFERLLEDLEPALYCHLNRRGVSPKLYATQWFLTLFAYRLPLQLVMRVFDLVLCEGLEGAILKFGMALVQKNADALMGMNDMQALTNFLKEKLFDAYIDSSPSSKSILDAGFFGSSGGSENDVYRADLLVQDACGITLTPDMLARYTSEWEEKVKTEKARETELENLRTDTATKAAQIRSLEQRAEKSDTEHIAIANELVKLKVENQDLVDQNESLNGQVAELRKVAESEAANVEERMRTGTEQVMQRNIEVQNENRHMEEQMAEMEKELVKIKIEYAELNAEHETLKQRWTDLRKAIE